MFSWKRLLLVCECDIQFLIYYKLATSAFIQHVKYIRKRSLFWIEVSWCEAKRQMSFSLTGLLCWRFLQVMPGVQEPLKENHWELPKQNFYRIHALPVAVWKHRRGKKNSKIQMLDCKTTWTIEHICHSSVMTKYIKITIQHLTNYLINHNAIQRNTTKLFANRNNKSFLQTIS